MQCLHWAVQEATERREQLFCVYLNFLNAFNSIDHEVLWWWLKELNFLMWTCFRVSTLGHTTRWICLWSNGRGDAIAWAKAGG